MKKVIVIFQGRGEEIKLSFWHIWIVQRLKFFCYAYFLTSAIFRGKQGVKVRPKMPSFGSFLFNKNSNPSKKTSNFFFARVLPLVRISAILDFIWGSKDPNTSQKEHWMLNRYAKLLNLTTTNAILMKLTTIMYLHESANRKALIARNSVFGLISRNF